MHHNGAFDVTFLHHRRPPSVPCLLVVHQALSDSSLALAACSSPASVPCLLVVHQALSDSSLALAACSSPASCS
ncbi:hypothetical protein [Klebsiella pneumoniae]|uniref:hypothetical protein n=1 Tax=Klebsiella pneumoniae TaxID=573 RepID=UPI00178793C2|nr:hypothetical protein [Klebsiella pneumoniae]